MAFAQRRHQRVDEPRIAPAGERLDRRPPHLPVVVGHRRRQRAEALDRAQRRQPVDRAQPRPGVFVAQIGGQLMLEIEALGDVLDGDRETRGASAFDQRRDRDALLHPVVARRRDARRRGDEVLVEGRSQHRRRPGDQRLSDQTEQPARVEIGHDGGKRPVDRVGRAMPVIDASAPSQLRTTRSASVVKMPMRRAGPCGWRVPADDDSFIRGRCCAYRRTDRRCRTVLRRA